MGTKGKGGFEDIGNYENQQGPCSSNQFQLKNPLFKHSLTGKIYEKMEEVDLDTER